MTFRLTMASIYRHDIAFAILTVGMSIIVSLSSVAGDDDRCGNCTCVAIKGMIKANCSNLNFSEIPNFGSSNQLIENLYLSKNNIVSIKKDSLSHLTNLSLLHLDYNRISTLESSAFLALTKISELKLNKNSLKVIKSGTFFDLPSLSTLRLRFNEISVLEDKAFVNLPKLSMIDLTNNSLSSIRGESFSNLPSLTTLFLRENQFSVVPRELCPKLPALKRLHLKKNHISVIRKLDFEQCFNLTYLQLSENQIECIDEHGFSTKMSGSVSKSLPLETLDLTQNKLTIVPTSSLRHVSSLKHLSLSKNMFRSIQSGAFESLTNLTIIHLSNSVNLEKIEIGAFKGLHDLSQLFLTNNKKLRSIPDYSFRDSQRLRGVFLENNALETLSENMLYDWTTVHILVIEANNFICSCDLVWIKKSKMLHNDIVFRKVQDTKCTENGRIEKILELNPLKLECSKRDTKSRIVTGLIAAGVTACIMLVCLAVVSFRRRIYSKYIHLKYHRQKDDRLFTVEDPISKRKVFSDKMEFRDDGRDETLM